jgi:hypothetical protein
LRKRVWFALIPVVAIAIAAILLTASWAANAPTDQESNQSPDFQASGILAVSPHYLSGLPYYPNNTYKITKIFLESATPWIGYANSTIAVKVGVKVPDGSSVLIINGTIRNDYTSQEIIQWSQEGVSDCYIGLDAYLYNKQGNLISVIERGNPLRGSFEVSLRGGEAASYNMVFITNSDVANNVAYYEIYVSYLRPIPQF